MVRVAGPGAGNKNPPGAKSGEFVMLLFMTPTLIADLQIPREGS